MASHGVPRLAERPSDELSEQAKQKEAKKIKSYRELVEEINFKILQKDYSSRTLTLTSTILTQNPEYYTIWNHRRLTLLDKFRHLCPPDSEQIPSGDLAPAQQEVRELIVADLGFLLPLLVKFPKCYWMWNHRLWLLQQALVFLPNGDAQALWHEELGLVSKMLGRDNRNFHGWDYRRMLVSQLEQFKTNQPEPPDEEQPPPSQTKSMTEHEFEYTTRMIRTNMSNFSAWHNRARLMPDLLRERSADATARRKMFDSEVEWIQEALYTDPYDQSLWFYYQHLISTLSPGISESFLIIADLTDEDRLSLYQRELDHIKEMIDDTDDCKWIYQTLLMIADCVSKLEAKEAVYTRAEVTVWLDRLQTLDPLRRLRWDDLRKSIDEDLTAQPT